MRNKARQKKSIFDCVKECASLKHPDRQFKTMCECVGINASTHPTKMRGERKKERNRKQKERRNVKTLPQDRHFCLNPIFV